MARTATAKRKTSPKKSSGKAVARTSAGSGRQGNESGPAAGEAFIKLLQSPLVAELVAVAATAALAALAEHGFTGTAGSRSGRAGKAVKAAGKAAAAAVGRRLGNELDEIRQAAKAAKGGAKA